MELKHSLIYNAQLMKKKTRLAIYSVTAGCAAGTLLWELLQLVIRAAGFDLDLTAGPAGFDISVIAVYVRINPGTVAGGIGTWLFVRKM